MSTFLQLCEQFREEIGVQGTISTVVNQTGMHARLINYIKKANRKIQRRKANWKFLWNEWSTALSAGVDGELTAPDGLSMFDQTSFWLDDNPLTYVDHKVWRDLYRHNYTDADEPLFVTIKPNGKVLVIPEPSADFLASTLTADYWRKPVELVSDSQVSLIPEEFHDVIVAQAKVYFAEKSHDTGLYQSAFAEHEEHYRELKAAQLPGNEDDAKSQASILNVIEIL